MWSGILFVSKMASLPDIQLLKEFVCSKLSSALNVLPGPKDLVLESELIRPLDRVGGISILKQNGVGKIFKFNQNIPSIVGDRRVFIIRADVAKTRQVSNCINADVTVKKNSRYAVLMVPRKIHVCERVLEEEGVFGYVTVESLDLGLIPLDTDILSLEMPSYFKTYFLDKDFTGIHTVAMSLVDVQLHYGVIPNVYGLGKGSQMVYQLMKVFFEEHNIKKFGGKKEIGHLFIFDRDIDYVSVLLSQLTYEGLLDEVFGINSGYLDLGSQVTGSETTVSLLLTSNSPVFNEIRNDHISSVFQYLSETSKKLQANHSSRQKMTIDEMRDFVANQLKSVQQQHQMLGIHVKACEIIKEKKSKGMKEHLNVEHNILKGLDSQDNISFIEEILVRQCPVHHSLRLLCLLSCTQNGLSPKTYKSLKTQFLQSYGFEHMTTFHNLRKLCLFAEQKPAISELPPTSKLAEKMVAAVASIPRQNAFQAIAKKLNLFPKCDNNYSFKDPADMGYVFSGAYIPLACSFVQQVLLKEGFSGLDEVLKMISNEHFSELSQKSARGKGGNGHLTHTENASLKIVLVYFLGGVTYAEIAALRFLGKRIGCHFIIASTSIINGNTMLECALEDATRLQENVPVE